MPRLHCIIYKCIFTPNLMEANLLSALKTIFCMAVVIRRISTSRTGRNVQYLLLEKCWSQGVVVY